MTVLLDKLSPALFSLLGVVIGGLIPILGYRHIARETTRFQARLTAYIAVEDALKKVSEPHLTNVSIEVISTINAALLVAGPKAWTELNALKAHIETFHDKPTEYDAKEYSRCRHRLTDAMREELGFTAIHKGIRRKKPRT